MYLLMRPRVKLPTGYDGLWLRACLAEVAAATAYWSFDLHFCSVAGKTQPTGHPETRCTLHARNVMFTTGVAFNVVGAGKFEHDALIKLVDSAGAKDRTSEDIIRPATISKQATTPPKHTANVCSPHLPANFTSTAHDVERAWTGLGSHLDRCTQIPPGNDEACAVAHGHCDAYGTVCVEKDCIR